MSRMVGFTEEREGGKKEERKVTKELREQEVFIPSLTCSKRANAKRGFISHK